MDYLQTLFGFFNAPLFATFILGMFWKRMTGTAAWIGLVVRNVGGRARRLPHRGRVRVAEPRGHPARAARARPSWRPPRRSSSTSSLSVGISLFTKPTPQEDLVGLVYSETPKEVRQDPLEHTYPWYRRTLPLAGISLAMVTVLNILF